MRVPTSSLITVIQCVNDSTIATFAIEIDASDLGKIHEISSKLENRSLSILLIVCDIDY